MSTITNDCYDRYKYNNSIIINESPKDKNQ